MDNNLNKGAIGKLFGYAKENRKDSTEEEELLWRFLRNRRLKGFKFRRQHPLKDFIVDFYCHEAKLVVEVDGGYHLENEQGDYDRGRTYDLKELEVRVIRFSNQEVNDSIDSVLKGIEEYLI
jgi:very-short-patch-repair endonuclease